MKVMFCSQVHGLIIGGGRAGLQGGGLISGSVPYCYSKLNIIEAKQPKLKTPQIAIAIINNNKRSQD